MSSGARWIFVKGGAQVDVNGPKGLKAKWTRGGATTGPSALLPTNLERHVLPRLFADADLVSLARDLGVDLSRQSLARLGDVPCHVLGARSGDRRSAQIWIDTHEFRVMRVRYRAASGVADLQLTEWDGPPAKGRFPGRIRAVEGRRTRFLEVQAAKVPQ